MKPKPDEAQKFNQIFKIREKLIDTCQGLKLALPCTQETKVLIVYVSMVFNFRNHD